MPDPRRPFPRLRSGLLRPVLLPAALLLAASPAAAASRPTITMEVTAEDGSKLPAVDVTDVSVGISRSVASSDGTPAAAPGAAAKPDEVSDQLSCSLDPAALSNAGLLAWVGKGAHGSSVQVKVTGSAAGSPTVTYVLTDLTSWSLNASHSTSGGMDGQLMLSLGARHLTVNGATVN